MSQLQSASMWDIEGIRHKEEECRSLFAEEFEKFESYLEQAKDTVLERFDTAPVTKEHFRILPKIIKERIGIKPTVTSEAIRARNYLENLRNKVYSIRNRAESDLQYLRGEKSLFNYQLSRFNIISYCNALDALKATNDRLSTFLEGGDELPKIELRVLTSSPILDTYSVGGSLPAGPQIHFIHYETVSVQAL